MDASPAAAVEKIARLSYGKLLAVLAVRSRDIAGAEDALGEALLRALEDWGRSGVPVNPEGWLVAVARRIDADRWRRAVVAAKGADRWLLAEDERAEASQTEDVSLGIPDDRLRLMLVCAHPAIDASIRAPLMLQVVLGIDAKRIASAFLVAPATMGQRLARAKSKIARAGLGFETPDRSLLPERISAVLDAVYAAHSIGWDLTFVDPGRGVDLVEEARWMAGLLAELLPGHGEAHALLALILFTASRRRARRAASGAYVPLSEQDTLAWDSALIEQAEQALRTAGMLGPPGRFGLEAAIQAVHAARRATGRIDYGTIEHLYRGLLSMAPTTGAQIGHVAALAELEGPVAALKKLEALPDQQVALYQPYWVLKGHLLARIGDGAAAAEAYDRAVGLTEDPASRDFLIARRQAAAGSGC